MPQLRLPIPGLASHAHEQRMQDDRPGQAPYEPPSAFAAMRDRVNSRMVALGRRAKASVQDVEYCPPPVCHIDPKPRIRWAPKGIDGSLLMRLGACSSAPVAAAETPSLLRTNSVPGDQEIEVMSSSPSGHFGTHRRRPLSQGRMRARVVARLKKTFMSQDLYSNPIKCIKSMQERSI